MSSSLHGMAGASFFPRRPEWRGSVLSNLTLPLTSWSRPVFLRYLHVLGRTKRCRNNRNHHLLNGFCVSDIKYFISLWIRSLIVKHVKHSSIKVKETGTIEIKYLAQGHSADQWQSWDFYPGGQIYIYPILPHWLQWFCPKTVESGCMF